jgi:hypothetical protein
MKTVKKPRRSSSSVSRAKRSRLDARQRQLHDDSRATAKVLLLGGVRGQLSRDAARPRELACPQRKLPTFSPDAKHGAYADGGSSVGEREVK